MEKERGSVVVEATIVVPVFLLAVFFILNFMNILMLHNRVQFAINASAHELASYSYLYTATGIDDALKQIEDDGSPYTSKIDDASNSILDCMSKIQSLSETGDVQGAADSGQTMIENVKGLITDPKGTLIGAGYMAADAAIYGAKNLAGTAAIKKLTEKYLEQGNLSADEYLKKYGVEGGYSDLKFEGTSMLNDSEHKVIDVVVSYNISLIGFQTIINKPSLPVVQRVSVPAWLDGDKKSPDSYGITKQ